MFWNEVFMVRNTVKAGQSLCSAVICRNRSAFEMHFNVSLHSSCNLLREKALISTCMYHGALVGSKHFDLLKQISKYLKRVQ